MTWSLQEIVSSLVDCHRLHLMQHIFDEIARYRPGTSDEEAHQMQATGIAVFEAKPVDVDGRITDPGCG